VNERIQELIVQSGNGQFHNDKCYPHIGSRTLEDWTKFAELIVRECMNVAVYKSDGMIFTADIAGHQAAGREIAAKMIKQHFGVE
jgi:hypothetical protein